MCGRPTPDTVTFGLYVMGGTCLIIGANLVVHWLRLRGRL